MDVVSHTQTNKQTTLPDTMFCTTWRSERGPRSIRVSPKAGDYARAQASGVRCVPLLVETFGGLSPPLVDALRAAAEWRKNKLTASEYDETTWSARTWMAFATQRLSVASQLSMAQEAAEALGLSVAADPRAQ